MKTIKKSTVLFVGIFFLNVNIMAQYKTSEVNEKTKPFPWPAGKCCAVSLTFDDARLSQIDAGIPLLNQHGIKATFYISPDNLVKRIDGWISAIKAGHEIGNHSMTHPCTGNFTWSRKNALEEYSLDRMAVEEMDRANQLIFDKLHVMAISFAYPCGQKFVGRGEKLQSYVPLVAKKFLTGRGWRDEGANDPRFCDFAQLLGVESDGKTFEELKSLVDKAAKENQWIVFAGHEMGKQGEYQTTILSSLEKLCQYAQNPANGIWIDTVASVADYIQKTGK